MKKTERIALDKHLRDWEPKTATYDQVIASIRSREPRTVDEKGMLDPSSSLIWRIQQTEREESNRLGFSNSSFSEQIEQGPKLRSVPLGATLSTYNETYSNV